MFSATPYVMGGASSAQNVTTFTRFAQNWSMRSLYGSTIHSSCSTDYFFCLVCVVSLKKKISYLIMFVGGGFGSTWGGTQNGSKAGNFDSHLRIEVMPLGSFPICLCMEAMHLQPFLPMRYVATCEHIPRYVTTEFVQNFSRK
jgi:hypothetical protein